MERYDAILEELNKAQSRGLETISNRLDFVVQSLEELIQEAKSSVQDALPQSAGECFPVDEVETALQAFRDEAESERQRALELESRIGELEGEAGHAGLGSSIELLRSLDGARTQSDLLKKLLPAISEHVARAVVLVLRDGKVSAWSGIGFRNGEHLRGWQGDVVESPALSSLLETSRPIRFAPEDDDVISAWLADEETPSEIQLIPVVLRGKLMGAVYVDRLESHPWDSETAQSLVAQVCWLIDTLQFRTSETPTLAEPVGIGEAVVTAAPEEPSEVEVTIPEVEVTIPAPPEEPEAAETAPAETDAVAEIPAESGDDPSATVKIDVSEMEFTATPPEDEIITEALGEPEIAAEGFEPGEPSEPEPEFAAERFEPEVPSEPEPEIAAERFEPETPVEPGFETPAEPEEEPAEEPAATVETPITAAIPTSVEIPPPPPEEEVVEESGPSETRFLDEPPPVQPVQPPPDEPEEELSEDEAQQEEARRFARLLVSEIKLYNEEQVERGREVGDLYQRLQEDIDRSREMFDKRISEGVRSRRDYFQDELVRILADGNPELLGS